MQVYFYHNDMISLFLTKSKLQPKQAILQDSLYEIVYSGILSSSFLYLNSSQNLFRMKQIILNTHER